MSERVSDDRLEEMLREDATLHGCDSASGHEVGLLAREVAQLRSVLRHPTYGTMMDLLEEMRADHERGHEPRIGRIGAMYHLLARFQDHRGPGEDWPEGGSGPRHYDPVNDSRGNGDSGD